MAMSAAMSAHDGGVMAHDGVVIHSPISYNSAWCNKHSGLRIAFKQTDSISDIIDTRTYR